MSSNVEQQLTQLLKEAMYAKDQRTADTIRMIKTKITERRTAPGFKGEITDELVVEVIAAYQKQLRKALEEYKSTGDRGAEMRDQLEFEIAFADRFLPKKASDDELRQIVVAAIATTGATDPKQSGKVVGEIMKAHKGRVDAGAAKKMVEEVLTKKG
jgi:uncharacterized protein YqeY